MTATASARFGEFAQRLAIGDVPAATQERVQLHLLDTLGAALAGSASQEAHLARRATRANGTLITDSAAAAVVWGTPDRAAPLSAAFVNGVAAHAFELDDSGGCDHSGAVVVPAALAAATIAPDPVSGEDLLLAVLLGYELGRRVQTAMGGYDAVNNRGWHSTGVCGTFAAAVAAGRVLGLNRDQFANAIGLAGAFTGGTWAFVGDSAMSKRLHVGRAAEGGLSGALLAREGFTGPSSIFEAPWGSVLDLYGAVGHTDVRHVVDGLGEDWQLDRASIKPHASCRSTHAAIDSMLGVRDAGPAVGSIERIEVHTSELIAGMCGAADIESLVAAQLSLPYALALAAVRGRVGLDEVLAGRSDPEVVELMRRVQVRIDPAQQGGSAAPWLRIVGPGVELTVQAGRPRGAWDNRLSADDVLAKFRGLADRRLKVAARDQLVDLITSLHALPDVRPVLNLLASEEGPQLIG